MSRPDEGLIHAWLDGELDAAESARVARLVETDAEWGAAAAEARGLIAASSRIVGALDVVPGGVIPSGSKAGGAASGGSAPVKPRFVVRPWMRIAAALVLVAGVGYVATESRFAAPEVAVKEEAAATDVIVAQPAPPPPPPAPVEAPPSRAATPPPPPVEKANVAADRVAPVTAPSAPAAAAGLAASADSSARRRLERERLSDVVVTGAAAAPAPTAQLRPRQVIERSEPSPFALRDAAATTGCWRVRTTAPMDTLLLEPRLVPERGDSLQLEVVGSGVTARVVREGPNSLTGTATEASGRRHPFSATRVSCP